MASGSLTDESTTHQSSFQNDCENFGNDFFVVSREIIFHLHLPQQDWLVFACLLALGGRMSQEVDVQLAHEWQTLSERLTAILSRVEVQYDSENQKTSDDR